jgi:hypothetical protein
VASAPDLIFVPLVLDDHFFLDTLMRGERRYTTSISPGTGSPDR